MSFLIFLWFLKKLSHNTLYKEQSVDFAPSTVEIAANSLLQPILSNFSEGINLRLRVSSAKYSPNWPYCFSLNPRNFLEK